MNLLVVKNQILFPLNVGGNIRTYNILRHLSKRHNLTFLSNTIASDADYRSKMSQLGIQVEGVPWRNPTKAHWQYYRDLARNCFSSTPFNVDKVSNPALRRRAQELLLGCHYDAVICDFVQMANVVKKLHAPKHILFQHNVEAQVLRRQAETSPGWFRSHVMAWQWRKMQTFEREAGSHFDAVIAVSDQDRATFRDEYGWQHVEVIDTAVDVEYFVPNDQVAEQNKSITFVASLDWLPNQDGASFFVKSIWPLIRRKHPDSIFNIVGRNPSRSLERLRHVAGVNVVGTVPDVRPYLSEAQVIVVPLLAGSGTRIKIFEAMAMGKAVVSTSVGAEGLKVNDQEHIFIADTPHNFANAVSLLLNDSKERLRIGKNARDLVCRKFSAEAVADQFERICEKVVRKSSIQEEG